MWQRHSRELIASVVCLISIYSFPYLSLASYDLSSMLLIHSFAFFYFILLPSSLLVHLSLSPSNKLMQIFIGIMCASSGLKCLSTKPCISTRMDDLLACFICWCAPFNVLLLAFLFLVLLVLLLLLLLLSM